MSCKDDFFEGSLSHISTWEVDRILYTVSSMNSKNVKKRRISDEEIDKNLNRIHQYPPLGIHIRKICTYPQMHYSRV